MTAPLRLASLISGGGRTLLNLADRIEDGSLDATIALVIASRADVPGVELARRRGLDVRITPTTGEHETIAGWLREAGIDLVCLCGYLRWIQVVPDFAGRIINIHPALLPSFGGKGMYGLRVHRAVLASGATESGCTVHFVDHEYDHGPIILQRCCPVLDDDDEHSLAARVFEQECIAYPEAVQLFVDRRIQLSDGRAVVSPGPSALP